jgi:hypothetical protein
MTAYKRAKTTRQPISKPSDQVTRRRTLLRFFSHHVLKKVSIDRRTSGRPGYHQQIHVVKPNALVETIDVAVLLSALIKVFDRVSFDKHNQVGGGFSEAIDWCLNAGRKTAIATQQKDSVAG